MLRKLFKIILAVLFIASVVLLAVAVKYPEVASYIRGQIEFALGIAPCQKPLTYSVRNFDKRFNISKDDLISAFKEASDIWSKTIDKELFKYAEDGTLKIDLIYDYRQEATDKLKKLGFKIENTKSSYDALKAEYLRQRAEYETAVKELEARIASVQVKKEKYDSDVTYWNKKGGAPKDIYDSLTKEKTDIQSEIAQIDALQEEANKKVAIVNAAVDALNLVAREINATVENFNRVGASTGEEFSEGLYISDITGQSISVYQFNNRSQLIRLAAHELGHALGLEHVDNPNAIMYKLNESKNIAPTAEDISELKQVCNIPI